MDILGLILLYGLWASIFSYNKLLLTISSPLFLTGTRMTFAGVLLLIYLFVWKRSSLLINRKKFIPISLLAIIGIYSTNVLETWGLKYLPAAKTCFIYSLSPFFAAILSYIHGREKITLKKWLGLLIGFLGFLPVLLTHSIRENNSSLEGNLLGVPELLVIGAALCSVYGWILLRKIVKDGTTSPLVANGISMLIGGILATVHSTIFDNWTPIPVVPGKLGLFLGGTFGVIIISNIICYNLYGYMLKRFTATFLSFAGLLSPIFSSIVSWILLGESLNPILIISTFVIASGLWIIYREDLRLGYIVKKKSLLQKT